MPSVRHATRGARSRERHVFHPLDAGRPPRKWITSCGLEASAMGVVNRKAFAIVRGEPVHDCPACFADQDSHGESPQAEQPMQSNDPGGREAREMHHERQVERRRQVQALRKRKAPVGEDPPICAECGEADLKADGSCCQPRQASTPRCGKCRRRNGPVQPGLNGVAVCEACRFQQVVNGADRLDTDPPAWYDHKPAPPPSKATTVTAADLRNGCAPKPEAESYTERLRAMVKARPASVPAHAARAEKSAEIQPKPCPGCAEDTIVLVRFEEDQLCPRCKRRLEAGHAVPEPRPCPGCNDDLPDEDLEACAEKDLCISHLERRRDHRHRRDTSWTFYWRPADVTTPCTVISTIAAPSQKDAEAFLRDDMLAGRPILITKRSHA